MEPSPSPRKAHSMGQAGPGSTGQARLGFGLELASTSLGTSNNQTGEYHE